MVGTIALLDDRLQLGSGQSPWLIWALVIATLLVVAGQAFATREVVSLHREVATRRFDERLTELVRRSSDMIAICDADGVIRYASPSSEQLLGVARVNSPASVSTTCSARNRRTCARSSTRSSVPRTPNRRRTSPFRRTAMKSVPTRWSSPTCVTSSRSAA
jgi:hypothetical protein